MIGTICETGSLFCGKSRVNQSDVEVRHREDLIRKESSLANVLID